MRIKTTHRDVTLRSAVPPRVVRGKEEKTT